MSISQRKRFEVFKRDGFVCAYCGGSPPSVILEIDHIFPLHPQAANDKPGTDEKENLLTSCKECNRGKSNVPLDKCPETISQHLSVLEEKKKQLRAYQRLLASNERSISRDIEKINTIYAGEYPGWELSEHFKRVTLRTFLQRLPRQVIEEAMLIAIMKRFDRDRVLKYFCGVCWKKIKGQPNADST